MSKPAIPYGPTGLVIKIIVAVLALLFIREHSAQLPSLPFVEGDWRQNGLALVIFWLTLLAPGFYLCALWAASDVFARMDKGDSFGPAIVKGVKEVGRNLVYGAIATIAVVPTLTALLTDRFRGVRYDTEIESVTIGLIGLTLYILAKQGQALKSELEQFI